MASLIRHRIATQRLVNQPSSIALQSNILALLLDPKKVVNSKQISEEGSVREHEERLREEAGAEGVEGRQVTAATGDH